jgi:hypothetical protein
MKAPQPFRNKCCLPTDPLGNMGHWSRLKLVMIAHLGPSGFSLMEYSLKNAEEEKRRSADRNSHNCGPRTAVQSMKSGLQLFCPMGFASKNLLKNVERHAD